MRTYEHLLLSRIHALYCFQELDGLRRVGTQQKRALAEALATVAELNAVEQVRARTRVTACW